MVDKKVLDLMIEQGGKFEKRLADLYFAADSQNSKKLESVFADIFDKYKKLAGVK